MLTVYPTGRPARDRFVIERRGPRSQHDPWQYQDLIVEEELAADGQLVQMAVVLLTGRECPWRCVMCDLWRHTVTGDTPAGAIPAQIAAARKAWSPRHVITQVKLYNAGSFFDPRAVPEGDYDAVASGLEGVTRVIVESHPALVGPRVDRFLASLDRGGSGKAIRLEVAMGLETAHPVALERLNKRMTVADFARAADALVARGVGVRAFVLIDPPFVPDADQHAWLLQSIDAALSSGADVVSLVPTRTGNGAMESLAAEQRFRTPLLDALERSVDAACPRGRRGRILSIFGTWSGSAAVTIALAPGGPVACDEHDANRPASGIVFALWRRIVTSCRASLSTSTLPLSDQGSRDRSRRSP
jgi:radical SAM enzyme (TIGR01210 family)